MSNGFVRWYRASWSAAEARRLVADLEHAGWMLTHPRSKKITIINEDGEQVAVQRDWLVESMALDGLSHLLTQWWLDDQDSDADHSIRTVPASRVVHEIFLDGISDHASKVGRDLLRLARETGASTVGFIFDRKGRTEDLNWDAIMAGADVPISVAPDLLALTPALDRLHPQLPGEHRTIRTDGLVIHDWNHEYPDFPDATESRGGSG